MSVSLESASSCERGVKPARVIAWRHSAIVRESGFLVLVEQLLQHSRGPRQYLMVWGWFVRGQSFVESVLVQTWQVFVVRSLSMVREAFGLSRCLVTHGAHHE